MLGTCLTDSPSFISAYKVPIHPEQSRLKVYSSVVVHRDDPLYAPVRDVLDSRCHRVEHETDMTDPEMVFGKAWDSSYVVYESCPDTPHCCAIPHPRESVEA